VAAKKPAAKKPAAKKPAAKKPPANLGRREPIRATFSVLPKLTVQAFRFTSDAGRNTTSSFMTELSASDLAGLVVVPVERVIGKTKLDQRLTSEWDRQLIPFEDDEVDRLGLLQPVIVSGRNGWVEHNDQIEVFEEAFVLDGARRLETLALYDPDCIVRVMVVLGLSIEEEIEARKFCEGGGESVTRVEFVDRFDSPTPRLVIGDWPVDLEILSDPFVVPTTHSYVPVLLVRRDEADQNEHVIVSARSLFFPLEDIRVRRGTLVGTRVRLFKDGDYKAAPYMLYQIGESESES
jgi:hypothetical protein